MFSFDRSHTLTETSAPQYSKATALGWIHILLQFIQVFIAEYHMVQAEYVVIFEWGDCLKGTLVNLSLMEWHHCECIIGNWCHWLKGVID